jgi:hypothetical protein
MCAIFRANPSITPGGGPPMMIAKVAHDAVLGVGVASELTPAAYDREVRAISADLLSIRPGSTMLAREPSSPRLPPGSRVCRLVVSAGAAPEPGFLQYSGAPAAVLVASLEDLELMRREAEDPDDVEVFLLEAAEAAGAGTLHYSSIREAWSVWRARGGAFHRAGAPGSRSSCPG